MKIKRCTAVKAKGIELVFGGAREGILLAVCKRHFKHPRQRALRIETVLRSDFLNHQFS